jgi:hypothetical protein
MSCQQRHRPGPASRVSASSAAASAKKDAKNEVKSGYRKLLQEVVADPGDADGHATDLKISSMMDRADALFKMGVLNPEGKTGGSGVNEEIALDATVFHQISRDLRHRVEGISINERKFKPAEYGNKMSMKMGAPEPGAKVRELERVMHVHCMFFIYLFIYSTDIGFK